MRIRGIVDEDFIQYKLPSMFLICPFCSFKCDKESNSNVCQNSSIVSLPIIDVDTLKLVKRYLNNPISKSIVFGGLEPFDSFDEVYSFIELLRQSSNDPIIIYTGYNKSEIVEQISKLSLFNNIIIKFGRYIPNRQSVYDSVLGKTLASDNQYAEVIS